MKAIQITRSGEPVQLREIPTPVPGPREVLIRVHAAGICHSDAHYRSGRLTASPLPLTLGHEVAGVVEAVGPGVTAVEPGNRVALHYLIACGSCYHCTRGSEQFCIHGAMLGSRCDGGWAEYVVVPERNAIRLPSDISFEHGAVLMCSSATSLHALRKARISGGESVAIFGAGGLGMSAVQLARAMGALDVYAVDLDERKLALCESFGAIAINAHTHDPVEAIRAMTDGRGVDVALELIGLPLVMQQAMKSLAVHGRAVIAGLATKPMLLDTYRDLLGKEAELIGANDHLLHEIPLLLEIAKRRSLKLDSVVTRTVPLDADPINAVLDDLDRFSAPARTVITPFTA